MSTAPDPSLAIGAGRSTSPPPARRGDALERACSRALIRRFERLEHGRLHLTDERGRLRTFGAGASQDLEADVQVLDPGFWPAVALRGSVGAGEAWCRGLWTSPDPVRAVRLVLRNRATLEDLDSGPARLLRPLLRHFHSRRANTRAGSRRNISAHYDMGNEFFQLFLDESLTYSAATWPTPDATLEQAQREKLERACRWLQLGAGDHVLEIGTGWGSFALHAAAEHGCRVTTTTISARQHAWASAAVARAGLADRVTILRTDYRDLEGTFDKLCSIEMVEAVGASYLDGFFRACADRLAPDGLMFLQGITIADQAWEAQVREIDYIKRHVFPGSCLLSVEALARFVAATPDLRIERLREIGPDYVRTLREWRRRLDARQDEARRLGFSDDQLRAWQYYFAYCEAGFAEGWLGDVQALLSRPEHRRQPA